MVRLTLIKIGLLSVQENIVGFKAFSKAYPQILVTSSQHPAPTGVTCHDV